MDQTVVETQVEMVLKTTGTKEVQDLNPEVQDTRSILKRVKVKVKTETSSTTNHALHHHKIDQEMDGDVTFVIVGIIPSGNVP